MTTFKSYWLHDKYILETVSDSKQIVQINFVLLSKRNFSNRPQYEGNDTLPGKSLQRYLLFQQSISKMRNGI